MLPVKIPAKILYAITKVLGFLYLLTTAYATVSLLTGWNVRPYEDGQFLHIDYPFTDKAFLNLDNNLPYIIFSFLLILLFYGLFFWLAAAVFSIFFQPKLFTDHHLLHLKRFYFLNIFIPWPLLVVWSLLGPIEPEIALLATVHTVLGVFIYFLSAIFKQGLKLQLDQDLII